MKSTAQTPEEYINSLPGERKKPLSRLRHIFLEHLPRGFLEEMSYGMISYNVPHSLYPQGYHCNPEQALPFVSIASQKNYIAIYHMGLYANPELLAWFTAEYPRHSNNKLDMGKSCIRFKKVDDIPFALIEELVTQMTPHEWISLYETQFKK